MKLYLVAILLSLTSLAFCGNLRTVPGEGFEDDDTRAININFKKIDKSLSDAVTKTDNQSISGSKTFTSTVTFSTFTATLGTVTTLNTTSLTATTVSASSVTVTNTITGGWLAAPYPMVIVQDEKSSGTNGGTFTSGAWQQRTLNTESTNTITGASLSSNQITLPSGTYYARWTAPAYTCDEHQTRFVSTPTATITLYGTAEHTNSTVFLTTISEGSGVFSISGSTVFQLEHRCQTTKATDGFGDANSFGNTQVYARVEIWKVR